MKLFDLEYWVNDVCAVVDRWHKSMFGAVFGFRWRDWLEQP